ncbi:unnamed protein product [Spirodela intermedia]|uniref:DYW domain-containing protein n=1 Tax=Spirodela intermedia TaxID=51605 RepID=A0A7I8LJP3_SPIIN|nr:unnamed protein product [Spirodela intermedia]
MNQAAQQLHAQLIKTRRSDPHSANAVLKGYAKGSRPQEALSFFFFSLRQQVAGTEPDSFTFPLLLHACSRLRAKGPGKQLHGNIVKQGLSMDMFVQNSLIHMYASCGGIQCALKVFERMSKRDVVSWTSIIGAAAAAAEEGCSAVALHLFDEMLEEGVAPNEATMVSVLRACADSGTLSTGRRVHRISKKLKLEVKLHVATALVDMYAKCGSIEEARELFDQMPERDAFAWTVMISGLASHGRSRDALSLFHRMRELGVTPDERTMTAVLSACRNAGMVADGRRYFEEMKKSHGIQQRLQHYGCLIDLLGRAGNLEEAEEFARRMPIDPDRVIWRTLAWASKIHGDTGRAERLVREHLLGLGFGDSGSFVLLGNIYSTARKWDQKARVWAAMGSRGMKKPPASSRIEINGEIHEFEAGDGRHREAEKIYLKLEEIEERLREEGHRPRISEVLLDVDEEEKAFQLRHHSEKLAVAFGLISSGPGEKIVIFKNLRSCEDCHETMKIVSRIYGREIIVRDRVRFHRFSRGTCSCGDFW